MIAAIDVWHRHLWKLFSFVNWL